MFRKRENAKLPFMSGPSALSTGQETLLIKDQMLIAQHFPSAVQPHFYVALRNTQGLGCVKHIHSIELAKCINHAVFFGYAAQCILKHASKFFIYRDLFSA